MPDLPESADPSDLVAYLDGELPGPRAEAVARRAERDEGARREVEALRETWGLLDLLPHARATGDLGTRTLTALRDLDDADPAPDPDPDPDPPAIAPRRRAAGLVVAALAAAGLGSWVTGRVWPDPDARLVRNLSLAEHLDEYRAVGSAEFLRLLDESDTFDAAEPTPPAEARGP